MKTYPLPKQNITFSKVCFFSHLLSSGTILTTIRNVGSFSAFKNNILTFFRPTPNNVFNCENHRGIKLISRLRVGLSNLREHKFKHNFQDTLSSICSCGFYVKSTSHYILHCPMYNDEKHTLLSTIKNIDCRC